jgi:hypothetical protein
LTTRTTKARLAFPERALILQQPARVKIRALGTNLGVQGSLSPKRATAVIYPRKPLTRKRAPTPVLAGVRGIAVGASPTDRDRSDLVLLAPR